MILNRYFLKTILSYTLAISLIFILIIVSSRSIQYLEQASRGEINPQVVFSVVLYRLPEFLELILPLGFFMAIVLTIGKFKADGELVVMEQSGFSMNKIYSLLAIPAALIISLLLFSNLALGPKLDMRVKNLLETKSLEDSFNTLMPGEFHKINDSYLFFAAEKDTEGLKDIFLLSRDQETQQNNILTAKTFNVKKSPALGLEFVNGYSYSIMGSDQLLSVEFENYSLKKELFFNEDYKPKASEPEDKGTLLWSLSICFLIIINILIALPLSKSSPRVGRYSRVLPSLLIFSIYSGILLSFKGSEISNIFYLFSTHLLFLCLSIFLNFHMYRVMK